VLAGGLAAGGLAAGGLAAGGLGAGELAAGGFGAGVFGAGAGAGCDTGAGLAAIVFSTTGATGAGVPTFSASAGTVVVDRVTPDTPVASVTVAVGAAAAAGVAPS
jgi:hypothetical protein